MRSIILMLMVTFCLNAKGENSLDVIIPILNNKKIERDDDIEASGIHEFMIIFGDLISDNLGLSLSVSIHDDLGDRFFQKRTFKVKGKSSSEILKEMCDHAECFYFISEFSIVITKNARAAYSERQVPIGEGLHFDSERVQESFYTNGPNSQIIVKPGEKMIKAYSVDARWLEGFVSGATLVKLKRPPEGEEED